MRALIPAYGEAVEDVAHVAATARAAGTDPVVIWQGHLPRTTSARLEDVALVEWASSEPLGKGGAVQHALRALYIAGPFLVIDGDLHTLEARVVEEFAEATALGSWARPLYPAPGRVARRLTAALDALGVDVPGILGYGGLLAPIQGHPGPRHALDSPERGPAWDLDVALRYLTCEAGHPLAAVPAGPRVHRPGNDTHLTAMLSDHLACAGRWVQW